MGMPCLKQVVLLLSNGGLAFNMEILKIPWILRLEELCLLKVPVPEMAF
jgi:hypothetical protein